MGLAVSVILSTYRQPAWLEKSLLGYALQTHRDFELLVADDGSGEETADVIGRLARETDLEPRHVRHEDRGHRKSVILNRAVVAARGEYLIFSDGDCIPRADFVAAHVRAAERGRFLSGGMLRLPRELSERIGPEDIRSGRFAELEWLRNQGWRPGHRILRLVGGERLRALLDLLTPTRATWNGHNASVWRDVVLAVNGFDGDMGYGGQDRAFGERLENLGQRGKQLRHRAICFHLAHERPYKTRESLERNRRIRSRIREAEETRAREGIAELEDGTSSSERGTGPS